MATALDATVKGASANSYVSLAEAQSYFDDRLGSALWGTDAPTQTKALLMAAKVLDSRVEWLGFKTIYTQRMQWPRVSVYDVLSFPDSTVVLDWNVLPQFIKDAQCEEALALLSNSDQLSDPVKGMKSLKVDVIELVFDNSVAARAATLSRPVRDLIAPWAISFDGQPLGGTASLVRT